MAHIIVLDSNEDIFVCGLCKSVFNSLETFLHHKQISCTQRVVESDVAVLTETEQIVLDEPNTIIGSPSLPTDNTQDEGHLDISFSCKICSKTMKTKKGLSTHTKSHYLKTYQCLVCGRCFIQNSHLQRHIPSHKVWPESLSDSTAKSSDIDLLGYSCPYCQEIHSNYNRFRAHLKVHQNVKVFKCMQGDCTSSFETLGSLLDHVSSTHTEPAYSCYICKENFHSLQSIYTHQQSHTHSDYIKDNTQTKQYKCLQCDAVYNKSEKLTLHMQTENHIKKCIHCDRTFASNKRLRLHLQVHRTIKPFKCEICNSSFHVKKYLTTHMLRHAKRNFSCAVCNSMFKRLDLLQRHSKLHQSNKLYKCPYRDTLNCKKEFNRKDKLKLHLKIHSEHKNRSNVSQNEIIVEKGNEEK